MQRLSTAALFPCLGFFAIRRSGAGFMCLLLQLTLIGWIPASVWAVRSLHLYNQIDRRLTMAIANALRHKACCQPFSGHVDEVGKLTP